MFDRVYRVVDRVDHGVADLCFLFLFQDRDFPPVAIGPHYLMSSDCVAFLTKNKQVLCGVGTLEDVSISVWLRAYGVVRWFSLVFVCRLVVLNCLCFVLFLFLASSFTGTGTCQMVFKRQKFWVCGRCGVAV